MPATPFYKELINKIDLLQKISAAVNKKLKLAP
jgi:hypothetical protein